MDVHTMFLSLDKEAQTPLYYQIKQQILHHISTGALGLGDLLPPEAEICEKLQISRPTVRQAMGDLVAEGYLTRRKGIGTFVSRPKLRVDFFRNCKALTKKCVKRDWFPPPRCCG